VSTLRDHVDNGRTTPGYDSSSGLPEPVELGPETSAALLRIAREAVTAAVLRRGRRPASRHESNIPRSGDVASPPPAKASVALDQPGAAFVTLTEHGSLRGCMGSLAAEQPLRRAVAAAGALAAVDDPRFMPVTEHELPSIHIDVSVLGPAVPLRDPMAFRPGIDGVIVARDGRRALFLPEVATDQGWGPREMFDAVCEKAGLEGHAWHDPRTRLFVFRTVRVSEAEATAGG
jgi:AmmeMemoRadiSam system protein A